MGKKLLLAWKRLPLTFKLLVLLNLYSVGNTLHKIFFTNYLYEVVSWGIQNNIIVNIFSTILGFIMLGIFFYILYTRKKKLFIYYLYYMAFNALTLGYYFAFGKTELDMESRITIFILYLFVTISLFFILYRQRNYFNK